MSYALGRRLHYEFLCISASRSRLGAYLFLVMTTYWSLWLQMLLCARLSQVLVSLSGWVAGSTLVSCASVLVCMECVFAGLLIHSALSRCGRCILELLRIHLSYFTRRGCLSFDFFNVIMPIHSSLLSIGLCFSWSMMDSARHIYIFSLDFLYSIFVLLKSLDIGYFWCYFNWSYVCNYDYCCTFLFRPYSYVHVVS